MKPITNITVSNFGGEAGRRACAAWDADGARYHVWFDTVTRTIEPATGHHHTHKHGTLYKNPHAAPGTPSPRVRYLDASTRANDEMIALAFEQINREGLIVKGRKADDLDRARAWELERDVQRDSFRELLKKMWRDDREELLSALSETLSMDDIDQLTARLP